LRPGVKVQQSGKRAALRDGPQSLGQLRRDRDWSPQALLKLVMEHPDQFSMTQVVEKGRQHPAIELGSELSAEAKRFVAVVRGGGKNGVTDLKIFRLCKITTPKSLELSGHFLIWFQCRNGEPKFSFFGSRSRKGQKLGTRTITTWRTSARRTSSRRTSARRTSAGRD
jgi:hypothetical protein